MKEEKVEVYEYAMCKEVCRRRVKDVCMAGDKVCM